MCGLVGVYTKFATQKDVEIFETMLQLDAIRGKDSTGVCIVKNEDTFLIKKTLLPQDLMDMRQYSTIVKNGAQLLMGHNRAATAGKVTSNNAHPFETDNVIGAHNGTLVLWHNLYEANKFTVDSEALLHHISVKGIEDAWLTKDGATALTYFHKQEKALYLVRNKERPLFTLEQANTVYYASEAWMIAVALQKAGVKVSGEIKEVPENIVHKYKDGVLEGTFPVKEPAPFRTCTTTTGGTTPTKVSVEEKGNPVYFIVDRLVTYWGGDCVRAEGHSTNKSKTPVTVIVDKKEYPELFELFSSTEDIQFYGKISSKVNGGYYVDVYSVLEIVEGDEDSAPFALADKSLVHCAWCDEVYAKHECVSAGGNEFVCKDCASLDEVKLYIKEA